MMRRLALAAAIAALTIGMAAPTALAASTRHDLEALRLECRQAAGENAIACHWSPSQSREFAAYRLSRAAHGHRAVVFRTHDRQDTSYLDRPLRPGRYRYRVIALDPNGRKIATSRVEAVPVVPVP